MRRWPYTNTLFKKKIGGRFIHLKKMYGGDDARFRFPRTPNTRPPQKGNKKYKVRHGGRDIYTFHVSYIHVVNAYITNQTKQG